MRSRRKCTAVLAAVLLAGAATGTAQAQDAIAAATQAAAKVRPSPWQPVIFAYGLEQAGATELDPFGAEGRREVVQLMAEQNVWQGRFVRSRMENGPEGLSVTRAEGWYEIRGDHIVFYHADAAGATGRVEVSGYQAGRICATDRDSGLALRYELIEGKDGDAVAPPPGAPMTPAGCGVSGAVGEQTGS